MPATKPVLLLPLLVAGLLAAGCAKAPMTAAGMAPGAQALAASKRKGKLPQTMKRIPDSATPIQVFKKPIPVKAEQLTEARTVQTKEGPVEAKAGDWLMTGVKGEQWPIPPEKFAATYEPVAGKPGFYAKKKQIVTAVTLAEPMTVKTSWGADINGKAGDWLVEATPEDRWIVEAQIFQETYAVAE